MDFITNVLSADKAPSASVLSLPATLLLAAVPHWYTIYHAESKKVQGGWANENPRAFVARLNAKAAQGKKLSDLEEMILRGQSAQQNAFEWWAVWAVAVVSWNVLSTYVMLMLKRFQGHRSLHQSSQRDFAQYDRTPHCYAHRVHIFVCCHVHTQE